MLFKKYLRPISGILSLGLVAFGLSGCGGDSSSGVGPTSGGFSGSTVTINPVITFVDGTNATYLNTESPTDFPVAASEVSGTYSYAPSGTNTTGTLTLTFPAPVGTLALGLKNFTNNGGNVTGFTATYNGRDYVGSITAGTVAVAPTGGSSGGTTGNGEIAATDIPASMQGTYELTYFESNSGSGIADGTKTQFVIAAKTLTFGGKTLGPPVFYTYGGTPNNLEWIFKDGSLIYAASIAPDNSLNEVNVGGPGGSPFYGQYREATDAADFLVDGQPVNGGTLTGSIQSGPTPGGSYLSINGAPTFTIGASATLTFSGGNVSFTATTGGAFILPYDATNSTNSGNLVYTQDLGNGEFNQVLIGVQSGNITFVTITFARKEFPSAFQAQVANYFIGSVTTGTAP